MTAAIPALEATLGDSDRHVRYSAGMALGDVGSNRPWTIGGLIRALAEGRLPEAGYCFSAALSLGRIGPAAKGRAPVLRTASRIATRKRATAAWALWRVSGDIGASVPILVTRLTSMHDILSVTGQPVEGRPMTMRETCRRRAVGNHPIRSSQRKVVEAALKNAPAEAIAEFKKAKTPLIEKINARGGPQKAEH